MQYLVHTGRAADVDPAMVAAGLPAEVAKVRALYGAGQLRQIWHRTDRAGAVLLLEVRDEEAAWEAMRGLPLVIAGAVVIESVVGLKPFAGFVSA